MGAFAFTLSVPLILIGNGIGAVVVRQLTYHGVERIRQYAYLKNGAMYSILVLGIAMLAHGFGIDVPEWLSPLATFLIVGYFFFKSVRIRHRKKVNFDPTLHEAHCTFFTGQENNLDNQPDGLSILFHHGIDYGGYDKERCSSDL